jgi:hypothetical protein
MSEFTDRFKTRLYYPPVDKPKLASGTVDISQVAANAVEKIVKLIPAEVVAGYSLLIYFALHVTREWMHIWLFAVAFSAGLIATPIYLYRKADHQKPYRTQILLSTIAFIPWAYLTTGKEIIPQYYDIAVAGFLVALVTLFNGCIPIRK